MDGTYLTRLAIFALLVVLVGMVFGILGLAHRAAALYTRPARVPVTETPAHVGLPYQDVRLETEDGLALAAWYVPSRNRAALVLVHGLGSNRGGLLSVARDLAARDYGLLLLDLRAHGSSEGAISTVGLLEVRDVRAAVRFLEQRAEVDPERIGVFGSSLGASTAIMAGAEISELRAVVADSAYASIDWLASNQFEAFVNLPTWMAPLVVRLGTWQAGVKASEIAPVERVARISPRPLLLIHGADDTLIRVENAYMLEAAAREPKELWVLPGAGHAGGYYVDRERYMERVGSFFDRALLAVESTARAVPRGPT